eukprot:1474500-Karenia_brevis.AAC.1
MKAKNGASGKATETKEAGLIGTKKIQGKHMINVKTSGRTNGVTKRKTKKALQQRTTIGGTDGTPNGMRTTSVRGMKVGIGQTNPAVEMYPSAI